MIIGITGKSGTGKSYLSEILAKKLKATHLDIDKISHEILSIPESKKFLVEEFGSSVFEDSILNRKKLGNIVFNNKTKLKKLNIYCKFLMEKRIDEIIKNSTGPIILDYALLCGLKQFKDCSIKILLKTDLETRYNRVFERENISKEYFLSRDNSLEEFNESDFDFVLENASEKDIKQLVKTIKDTKQL